MSEEKRFKARVAHKHKTEAEWHQDVYEGEELRTNPFVPLNGELVIFDEDENYNRRRFKFGDGETDVINLPFAGTDLGEIKDEAKKTGTKGLAYELSEDKTYYICTGIGNCEEAEIAIASEIDGLPVSEVGTMAFYENMDITKVIIPNSVMIINE